MMKLTSKQTETQSAGILRQDEALIPDLLFVSDSERHWSPTMSSAYGIVMDLSQAEIEQLYSEESVRAYRPEALPCELAAQTIRLNSPRFQSASHRPHASERRCTGADPLILLLCVKRIEALKHNYLAEL